MNNKRRMASASIGLMKRLRPVRREKFSNNPISSVSESITQGKRVLSSGIQRREVFGLSTDYKALYNRRETVYLYIVI
jgi:hypothetical protein